MAEIASRLYRFHNLILKISWKPISIVSVNGPARDRFDFQESNRREAWSQKYFVWWPINLITTYNAVKLKIIIIIIKLRAKLFLLVATK